MTYVFDPAQGRRYQFPTHRNDIVVPREDSACAEVFVVVVEPGSSVHLHSHPDYEQIFHITEGEGLLSVGGEEIPVRPGHVVRIPVGTLHCLRAAGPVPVRYLCIDCFTGPRLADEPTWDDHVRAICRDQGYRFEEVAGPVPVKGRR